MTKIHHPTWPDVERDVPADEVDRWVKAGWSAPEARDEEPAVESTPEPEPPKRATRKRRS